LLQSILASISTKTSPLQLLILYASLLIIAAIFLFLYNNTIIMSSSNAKKKARAKAKKAAQEAHLKQQEALIKNATEKLDPLTEYFNALKHYKRTHINNPPSDFTLNYYIPTTISNSIMEWMLDLTRRNLKSTYDKVKGWGWSDKKKLEELKHEQARFIIVTNNTINTEEIKQNNSISNNNNNDKLENAIGFVHIRFEIEDNEAICYLYEIQIEKPYQKRGIGRYLMQIIE
jgi:hypothetical protein